MSPTSYEGCVKGCAVKLLLISVINGPFLVGDSAIVVMWYHFGDGVAITYPSILFALKAINEVPRRIKRVNVVYYPPGAISGHIQDVGHPFLQGVAVRGMNDRAVLVRCGKIDTYCFRMSRAFVVRSYRGFVLSLSARGRSIHLGEVKIICQTIVRVGV